MLNEEVIREIYRQNLEMAAYYGWRLKSDPSQVTRELYEHYQANALTLSMVLEIAIDVLEVDRRMKRTEEGMQQCENAPSAEKTQTT
jgi:hypothetical protein